jgi:hypothetical protein
MNTSPVPTAFPARHVALHRTHTYAPRTAMLMHPCPSAARDNFIIGPSGRCALCMPMHVTVSCPAQLLANLEAQLRIRYASFLDLSLTASRMCRTNSPAATITFPRARLTSIKI